MIKLCESHCRLGMNNAQCRLTYCVQSSLQWFHYLRDRCKVSLVIHRVLSLFCLCMNFWCKTAHEGQHNFTVTRTSDAHGLEWIRRAGSLQVHDRASLTWTNKSNERLHCYITMLLTTLSANNCSPLFPLSLQIRTLVSSDKCRLRNHRNDFHLQSNDT